MFGPLGEIKIAGKRFKAYQLLIYKLYYFLKTKIMTQKQIKIKIKKSKNDEIAKMVKKRKVSEIIYDKKTFLECYVSFLFKNWEPELILENFENVEGCVTLNNLYSNEHSRFISFLEFIRSNLCVLYKNNKKIEWIVDMDFANSVVFANKSKVKNFCENYNIFEKRLHDYHRQQYICFFEKCLQNFLKTICCDLKITSIGKKPGSDCNYLNWTIQFHSDVAFSYKVDPKKLPNKENYEDLYENDIFSDFKIIVGDVEIPVHRLVIYKNGGDYMKIIITSKNLEVKQGKLHINGFSLDIVKLYLKFVYQDIKAFENMDIDVCSMFEFANFTINERLKTHCLNLINLTASVESLDALNILYSKYGGEYLKSIIENLSESL